MLSREFGTPSESEWFSATLLTDCPEVWRGPGSVGTGYHHQDVHLQEVIGRTAARPSGTWSGPQACLSPKAFPEIHAAQGPSPPRGSYAVGLYGHLTALHGCSAL